MKRSVCLLIFASSLLACYNGTEPTTPANFEVWLVDQSNSVATPAPHGGRIHIYNGTNLTAQMPSASAAAVIDLGQSTATLCNAATGAPPVRPHMLFFNTAQTHAVLAFVVSGHVAILDAAARTPIACLRSSAGAGGARQAHAAVPSPDGTYILVANQNGKLLERIDANYATNTYTLNAAATLNLATCRTPSGAACEAVGIRPDNAPICPVVEAGSRLAFVTLRGGGLLVVDAKATPMQIVGEYTSAIVHGNGCGGVQAGNSMYINSGGATASNMAEFDVYRFPITGYASTNPANTPAPAVVFTDDVTDRDSHGTATTRGDRYLWVADRTGNRFEVFELATNARMSAINLSGALTTDPSPDLVNVSPSGDQLFVSLRGPTPLSGDPHASTGSTPGLGILQVQQDGRTGVLSHVLRISNLEAGVERADPHGLRVRRK